ncbi:hypothetical protein [Flavobacterium cyclinae]|uniref:hypothetical protein n=1 Tax=Flavobacterium cyclinae TaxID=2895947 RepID=UPI001E3AE3B0|nr:hypothetical protein [Flavobacterium cyclinae]UGS19953.1 hypothetical protein LOS86_07940 [Flavobacterium cyclinae]
MKRINLINGNYNCSEAKEILMDLCNKNLNSNKLQNFSSQIRFGKDDDQALQQINTLNKSKSDISEIIEDAKQKNKKLIIKSFIEIEYEN